MRVRMVYVSTSKSLAVLESLVHLNPPVVFKHVGFGIEFDEAFTRPASCRWSADKSRRQRQHRRFAMPG